MIVPQMFTTQRKYIYYPFGERCFDPIEPVWNLHGWHIKNRWIEISGDDHQSLTPYINITVIEDRSKTYRCDKINGGLQTVEIINKLVQLYNCVYHPDDADQQTLIRSLDQVRGNVETTCIDGLFCHWARNYFTIRKSVTSNIPELSKDGKVHPIQLFFPNFWEWLKNPRQENNTKI